MGSTTNDVAVALSSWCVEEPPVYEPSSTALLGERTWLGLGLGLGVGVRVGVGVGVGVRVGVRVGVGVGVRVGVGSWG